jgi:hypothetical protein
MTRTANTKAKPNDEAARLRAWWSHKQGLDGSLDGAPAAAVLERTGWARSVGGVGPYLTLFSRAGVSRPAADAAVATLEIHELPAARGSRTSCPRATSRWRCSAGQPRTERWRSRASWA